MVGAPSLFMKTLGAKRQAKEAREIREGPEGKWIDELGGAAGVLRRLARSRETIFHSDRRIAVLATLGEMNVLIRDLYDKIRNCGDDHAGDDRGCSDPGAKGNGDPPDKRGLENIEKHGQAHTAGDRPD